MKNGQFIGQFAKEITKEEIDKLVDLVKGELTKYHVSLSSIEVKEAYSGCFIKFHVAGLDYVNKTRKGDTVTGIKTICCYFTSKYGFDDYDYLVKLEAEGRKTVENATCTGYSFNFYTDAKLKEYRRHWRYANCLEGKGHYIYNDDLNDRELAEDISSYFVNLMAIKGR